MGYRKSAFVSVFSDEVGDGSAFVAFHALTGALAVLDERFAAALDAGDAAAAPELLEAGLLVDAARDERAELRERHLRDMNETGFLSLCIAPTMACNLRCAYCYEDHEPVRMTPAVEDGIMRFVERRYGRFGFRELDVMWYGGEPLLEIDLVERLSGRLIAWCEEHGVSYSARVITNATLATPDVAERLAAARVTWAMPTLDGCAGCHDARRPRADGEGSFEATLSGVRALRDAGAFVGVNCNLDARNVGDYRRLRAAFTDEPNIEIYASHLRNYGGWSASEAQPPAGGGACEGLRAPRRLTGAGDAVGERSESGAVREPAREGGPELMTRQEYADELFALYEELRPTADSARASLRAQRCFCRGKTASYFVVDPEGNVCRCDGFVRDPSHVLFSVLDADAPIDWPRDDCFLDREDCAACAAAPLCLGDCDWERSMFRENCSAVKLSLGSYVRLLRRLDDATPLAPGEHVRVLERPRDPEALYARPFSPNAGESVM